MAPHRRDWSAEAPADQPGLKFRFMSWNVLAAELAHTHAAELYPQAPSSALAWPSRLQGVIAHVEEQRPDVVCLQEVDDWPGIRNALAPLGYEGVHVQRTGGRGDGCATLWLRDRLCVAGPRSAPRRPSGSASGSRPGSQSDGVGVIPILMADHGLRDNVALVVHLRPRSPGEDRRGGRRAGSEGEGRGGGGGGSRQAGPRRAAPSGSDMELEEEEERLDRGGGQGRSDRTSSDGGASGSNSGGSDGGGGDAGGLRRRLEAQPSGTPRHKRFRSSDEEAEGADGGGGGRGGGGGGEAGRATAAATAAIAALRPYTPNARQTAAPSSSRDTAAAAPGPGAAPQRLAGSGAGGQALPPEVQQGFLVANTHILFNTKRGDIKLGQLRVVLNALAAAAAQAAARKAEAEAEPGAEADDPAGAPSAADAAATAPGEVATAEGGESEGSRSKRRQRRKSAAATPDAAAAAAAAARAAALLRDGDKDGDDASTAGATAAATAPHRAVSAPALGAGAAAAADPDGPTGPPPLPCIFAGDFNSAPGSGLYRFLSGDRLDLAGEDRRELSGQVEGYGYPSLQRDVQYGRPPRLTRWAPPPPAPPLPPAAALGRAASNRSGSGSDMERGASGGRLYAVRWEVEELVHAMGQAAVADSMAAAKAATASAAAAAAGPAGAGDGTAAAAAADAAAADAAASGLRVPFQPPQPTPWQQKQGRGRGGGGGGSRGGDGGPPSDWWARPDAAVVRNPLAPLASAYAAADPAGREPLFTTLHARYVGTVDFVWYTPGGAGGTPSGASGSESAAVNGGGSSSNGDAVSNGGRRVGRSGAAAGAGGGDPGGVRGWRLEPVRVLHPPDPLAYMYGMPCHGWPSDHVSLVVDFRLSQG